MDARPAGAGGDGVGGGAAADDEEYVWADDGAGGRVAVVKGTGRRLEADPEALWLRGVQEVEGELAELYTRYRGLGARFGFALIGGSPAGRRFVAHSPNTPMMTNGRTTAQFLDNAALGIFGPLARAAAAEQAQARAPAADISPARRPQRAPAAPPSPRGLPPKPPPQHARYVRATAAASHWAGQLPDFLVQLVFATLLVDARARCASVCPAWEHALLRGADAWRLWTRLDLSGGSGVTCVKCDAALAGAAALARGRLQELDLSNRGVFGNRDRITLGAVLRVLRGSPELRVLALDGVDGEDCLEPDKLQQLLAAAPPTLQRLDAAWVVCTSSADSLPMLRAEPPYGPLRMAGLTISGRGDPPHDVLGSVVGARTFGAAVAHNVWLRELWLTGIAWTAPAALEALVDGLLAGTCRVERLELDHCKGLSPDYLPALARLLAGRAGAALANVELVFCRSLFDHASAAAIELVCAALRGTALTDVRLAEVGLSAQSEYMLYEAGGLGTAAPRLRLRFN